ncbi:MAG: hypothetical protein PW792_01360 [Acidobacteriaceae bacterium]|nr:hypothetical protein [Acidobacteriaceae bacterium]
MIFSRQGFFSGVLGLGLLLLTGCGMGAGDSVQQNVASTAFTGRSMGGQQPLVGATIGVYAYGTGGYGSAATLLASTTTDSGGNFAFASSAYTCPQSDTPVYLLSTGGDPGAGSVNANAVQAIALGTCTVAKQSHIVINEVTTVAMAYALAHFFNTNLSLSAAGGGAAGDNFGGPSSTSSSITTFSRGLVLGNNVTVGLIARKSDGSATVSSGNMTTEAAKVYGIANILASCVNSTGQTSTSDTSSNCGRLFNFTSTSASGRPTDTLQAAVQMALHPTVNVSGLYILSPSTPAFGSGLSSQPNDWSLAISFTNSAMGMGVDTNTLSTIDIDSSNRVWFPSTISGGTGVAYFDPATTTFNGPYNGAGLVHPEQVAIDGNGYAWATDTQGAVLGGFNTNTPTSYSTLSIAGSTSYSLGVDSSSQLRVGVLASSNYKLATVDATRSTYSTANSPTGLQAAYLPQSIASDASGNLLFTQYSSSVPRFYDYYLASGATSVTQRGFANDLAGQAAFTGGDLVGVRSYNNGGGNNAVDGLCFQSNGTCGSMGGAKTYNRPAGIAVDGDGTLWLAYNQTASVASIPQVSGTGKAYSNYLNSNTQFTSYVLNHNSTYGGTLTSPEGIAVDNEGNLWVANSGCSTSGCTPGSFVLTVLPGQAAPTITPVSAQITSGSNLAGTYPAY